MQKGINRALFAFCAVMVCAVAAPADEVDDTFNSLFALQIKQALATPDPKDDIALAGEMIAAAKQFPQQKKLVTKLCKEAWDLTNKRETGWETAATAMTTLTLLVPDENLTATTALADLRQRQYSAAKGPAKAATALELVNALDAAAAAKETARDEAGALAYLKQAIPIARTAAKDRVEDLQSRHDRAAHFSKVRERAAKLEAELKAAPDAARSEELARLYLSDLDQPAAAAPFIAAIKDDAFRNSATLATKLVAEIPLESCRTLGLWYRTLASAAPAPAKPALLARAYACLDRFVAMYETKDLNRTHGELLFGEVSKAIDGLGNAAIRPPRWVKPPTAAELAAAAAAAAAEAAKKVPENLLETIDLDEDTVLGLWKKVDAGGFQSPDTSGLPAHLQIPVLIDGDYKLTLKLKREKNFEAIVVALPLPDGRQVSVIIDGWMQQHGGVAYVEWVDRFIGPENPSAVKGWKIKDNEWHTLEITVKHQAKDSSIDAVLDGAPLTRWTGPRSVMWVTHHWRGYNMTQPVLGTWSNSVTFESVKLQMLTGKATRAPRVACDKLPEGATYLADMKETVNAALQWQGGVEFGKKGDFRGSARCVKINGVRSFNAIYAHPAWPSKISSVSYDLAGKYKTFVAAAGINDLGESAGSELTFIVRGDDRELWRSRPVRNSGAVQPVQVDITGVQKLELVAEAVNSVANARAVWVEAAVFEKAIAEPLVKVDTKPDLPRPPIPNPNPRIKPPIPPVPPTPDAKADADPPPLKPGTKTFFGVPIE